LDSTKPGGFNCLFSQLNLVDLIVSLVN